MQLLALLLLHQFESTITRYLAEGLNAVRSARFRRLTHVSHAQTDRRSTIGLALKVKQVMVRFSRLKMAAGVGGEDALKVKKNQ